MERLPIIPTTQAKGLFLFPQQKPGVYKIELTKVARKDVYDVVINEKGEAVPTIPLELILRD